MKNFLIKTIGFISRPFVGTGIGSIPPFSWVYSIIQKNLKKGYQVFDTSYGFKMYLDGDKTIDQTIIITGLWEENIGKTIIENLELGDTFIDIGANIGYFSLLGSQAVGKNGKVISFEPSTSIYNELKRNVKLNNYKNIEIHKLGVGDKEGEYDIYYCESNPGSSSILKPNQLDVKPNEKIKTIILDNFLEKETQINLIKLDVEGYEYEVVLGMENILKKENIKLIFEFSPIIYKEKKEGLKLLQKLNDLSFNLYHININGKKELIKDFNSYYDRIKKKTGQSNIICFKD